MDRKRPISHKMFRAAPIVLCEVQTNEPWKHTNSMQQN
jgi:hypothetical protein